MTLNMELLRYLQRHRGEWLSLEVMAEGLGQGLSRLARDLIRLEEFGFGIERVPHRGVRYTAPARRLCPDQIEWQLATRTIGRRIAVWNRVTSTNDVAARARRAPANDGLVVLAEHQTAGRGRRGHRWFAPAESCVLMSVLLFPPRRLRNIAWLTCLGAVAAADTIATATGLAARIKWPNDVRVQGRKVCGVLVEDRAAARRRTAEPPASAVVVGIGINVNVAPESWPADLRPSVVSLAQLTGQLLDRSALVRELMQQLDRYYQLGRQGDLEAVWERYRVLADLMGRIVEVRRVHAARDARHGESHAPPNAIVGRLIELCPVAGLRVQPAGGDIEQFAPSEILSVTEHGIGTGRQALPG
jgi:BirA family biotin operon repressor/biotin-[acetyl-CoA-carboxylase] ligase